MDRRMWKIVPTMQIGEVEFDTPRKDVQRELGKASRSFRKTIFSKNMTDEYDGFHVYYSKSGALEAVEIFEGTVLMGGKQIFPGTIDQVRQVLPDLEYVSGSYISKNSSVGLYAPDKSNIESILVGRKSYYD